MNTIRKLSEIIPEVNIGHLQAVESPHTSNLKIIKVDGTVNHSQEPLTNNQIITKHANALIPNYQINKELFTNLKIYFLGGEKEFNPKKGLFFFGGVGAGKTSIMKIFRAWLNDLQHPNRFNIFSIRQIEREYKIDGFKALDYYTCKTYVNGYGIKEYKPENICIDDIGTESLAVKNYGDQINVFTELIQDRYDLFIDKNIITHATTNIPPKEFKEIYSDERVESRLREMFNIVYLPNNDYRKGT